ncbi:extracellular solute-binding protein [Microbispora sp. RL4-1S]|uniref:Extracellular solute-binding protein n=2 Tax=Microbispora oryzae TaxID=2806554 RepID=A0A941AIF5_9ACTN|nr:extracellular solute-binding protein [Microbispora oryzae]
MKPHNLSILLVSGLALTAAAACGSGDGGSGGDKAAAPGAGAKVTITVGCQPPKTNPVQRDEWNEDVAAFQKLHPDITIDSKDGFPCHDVKTYDAKLAGGQMENVFYGYVGDVQTAIKAGQAADITDYVKDVATFADLDPSVMAAFTVNGRIYGLPRTTYKVGLVYNRKLFTQAGLDPDNPPKTWAELREAAKKISGLGPGYIGYGEYSAGNTGGWHFTQEIYGRGGSIVSDDGKKATFNSAEGKAVLQNLKDMRWTDNSMGTKQLYQWDDLMRLMGAGKMGMILGAPDVITELHDNRHAKYEDFGLGAFPEATATLGGGDGYLFNVKDTPEQIRAGIAWLSYYNLTPGQGQFNYERQKAKGRAVGLPDNNPWGGSASGQKLVQLRTQFSTLPAQNYKAYEDGSAALPLKLEPPNTQQLYQILDTPMSAVLTRQDADVDSLLADAEKKVDDLLARSG